MVAMIVTLSAILPISPSFEIHASGRPPTETFFDERLDQFTTLPDRPETGIFIYRTPEVWNTAFAHDDVFTGSVHICPQSFPGLSLWRYTPVKFQNDVWQPTSLFNTVDMGMSVRYYFRKGLPRGLYGIKAQAFENAVIDGVHQTFPALRMNPDTGLEEEVINVYEILYGDSPLFMSGMVNGQRSINTWRNIPQSLTIDVALNDGAMNLGALTPQLEVEGFVLGNLYRDPSLDTIDMEIRIERNGVAVSTDSIPRWGFGNTITLDLSRGLSYARYVVRFSHPGTDTHGTFMIDNTSGQVYSRANLSGAVVAFMVLGTLAAAAAAIIFATPKIVVASQERRYQKIQNERYMQGEGAIDDKAFKAQSARSSLLGAKKRAGQDLREIKAEGEDAKQKTRAGGFLDSIRESRVRREIAREHGLTMEQYKELETKHKEREKAKVTSLADFRAAVAEEAQKTKPAEYKADDGFEMLSSVEREALTAEGQIIQGVVQPNIAGEGSIVGALREIAGDEETARVEIADKVEFTPLDNMPTPEPVPSQEVPEPTPEPVIEPLPIPQESAPAPELPKPTGILSRIRKFTEE